MQEEATELPTMEPMNLDDHNKQEEETQLPIMVPMNLDDLSIAQVNDAITKGAVDLCLPFPKPAQWGDKDKTAECKRRHFASYYMKSKRILQQRMRGKAELVTPEGESYYILYVLYIYLL